MKKIILFASCVFFSLILHAQVSKTLAVTPGILTYELSSDEKNTITNLTLTGTINAKDFKLMRDEMPLLSVIDLSGARVSPYTGTGGTQNFSTTYPANTIPDYCFSDISSGKGKSSLTSIVLPSNVEAIGSYSFMNCEGLISVIFPSTLSSIGYYAFKNCTALSSINLPSLVTTINNYAFYNCSKIVSIQVNSPVPIDLRNSPEAFYSVNKSTVILKVPLGSKATYQSASQWSGFLNIEELSGFFISSNSVNLGANTETTNIVVASSSGWSAVSDQDWLTLHPGSGGIGSSNLEIEVTSNQSNSKRVATITISAPRLRFKDC